MKHPEQFTDDETQWLVGFLNTVMVDQQLDIQLPPSELALAASAIAYGPDTVAKLITSAIAAEGIEAIFSDVLDVRGPTFSDWFDPKFVEKMAPTLSASAFKGVLEHTFKTDPEHYRQLKRTTAQWTRVGGTFVTPLKASELLETRADRGVALITKPTTTLSDVDAFWDTLGRDFDLEELDIIITQILETLRRMAIGMATADQFRIHLSIHRFLTRAHWFVSESEWTYWDGIAFDALMAMPTVEWSFKVLAQFEVPSMRRLFLRIESGKSSATLATRNRCLQLEQTIVEAVDTGKFENVRLANLKMDQG